MLAGKKYSTLLSLYIAQSIPMSFFTSVLPVVLRMEGISLETIGMLQLIKLPWLLKFFWSPVVDITSHNLGGYKKWIITSELFYALVILIIGFFNITTSLSMIIGLMALAVFISATQDIATDAFAINILTPKERGVGNGIQSAGGFIGSIIGSGILLALYSVFGWQYLFHALAIIVLLAIIPLSVFFKRHLSDKKKDTEQTSIKHLFRFFKIKGIGKTISFIILLYLPLMGILAMFKPFLVDCGYTIGEIAFMSGVFGPACAALTSFLFGRIIRQKGLFVFIRLELLYLVLVLLYLCIVTLHPVHVYQIYILLALLWSAYSGISVIVYTLCMNTVRKGWEGTDYSLQIATTQFTGMIMAGIGGKIAHEGGYTTLFAVSLILSVLLLGSFHLFYKKRLRL